ncbi:PDR/VanB family oxidoreductase [Gammaproteobacteria bacterium]|nr:PDR/VanB family oxidoreductase [Gammaproteobacteria bacterium]
MSQIKLKVTDIQQLTANIKMFEFQSTDGERLPTWDAGSHIDFQVGDHMRRSYSLANAPGDTERYVTAILREADGGGGSKYMHDEVSVGDELVITEPPSNLFPLDETAKSHLLLGGGIGITPLRSMGYRLRELGADFHLHYCTKSKDETAFYDEIVEIFGNDGVTFYHDGGDPSKGIQLEDILGVQDEGQHLYICGPSGLINAARDGSSHWRDGTVHFELFASANSDQKTIEVELSEGGDQPFEVELKQSGISFTVPADKSIIELLWANNVDVMYACEDGWCGNCKVGLISGKVDHRDEFLDESDRENFIQVCVSRAMPGEKLVLDI